VATVALTQHGHAGKVYELTGPDLLSFDAMAAELSKATGRTISYVPMAADEWVDAAVAGGLPAEQAEPLAELFTFIFDGHNASVADGVADALGRAPRTFRQFAATAAALGAWD
jgi:uncharacterized protein YbjT (DUF2867 family)